MNQERSISIKIANGDITISMQLEQGDNAKDLILSNTDLDNILSSAAKTLMAESVPQLNAIIKVISSVDTSKLAGHTSSICNTGVTIDAFRKPLAFDVTVTAELNVQIDSKILDALAVGQLMAATVSALMEAIGQNQLGAAFSEGGYDNIFRVGVSNSPGGSLQPQQQPNAMQSTGKAAPTGQYL